MTRNLKRLLQILTVIDGRSRKDILSIAGGSTATFKRDLDSLRELGASIRFSRRTQRYELLGAGVIDVAALRTKTLLCSPVYEPLAKAPRYTTAVFQAWTH